MSLVLSMFYYKYLNTFFRKNLSLAFNINIHLIYKLGDLNFNKKIKKIYVLKCKLIYINKIFPYKFNKSIEYLKKYIFNDISNTYLTKQIKKSGYFNIIEYTFLYTQKSKYLIFHIKSNYIIKKIKIYNYNHLQISKNFVINLFKHQIGLPINYSNINENLYKINKWYKIKGFKANRIKYKFNKYKNEILIQIYEGKIFKSYCIYDQIILNQAQKTIITNLNSIIKKELYITPGNILNIYQLEFNILQLKKKYCIKDITYKVENNKEGIIIIIKYNLYNQDKILIYRDQKLKNHINNIQLFKISITLSQRYKSIIKYIYNISNNINSFLIKTNYSWQSNYFSLIHTKILIHIFIYLKISNIIPLIYIMIYSPNISQYNLMSINNIIKIILDNLFFYNYLLPIYKNKIYNYSNDKFYSYLVKNLKIKIKTYVSNLININIIQYFIFENSIKTRKNFLIYTYENFKNYKQLFYILNKIKKNQHILLKYNLKCEYNKYSLLKNKSLAYKQIYNIHYKIWLSLNEKTLYKKRLIKNYINIIKIKYYKKYKSYQIINYDNRINLMGYINIQLGHINQYFYTYQNIYYHLNNKLRIFLKLEYELDIKKNHVIYFYWQQNYFIKLISIYLYNIHFIKYYNNIDALLNLGIGIKINIPMQYMPNIRLEVKTNICENQKYFLYFHIKPLLKT